MKTGFLYVIIAAVLIAISGCGEDDTVILIVRHAEKATTDTNTNLDPDIGLDRARVLADIAAERGVTAIYSTEWCRTAQTVWPAAARRALPINVVDSGRLEAGLDGCDPPIGVEVHTLPEGYNDPAYLSRHILENHRSGVVLVSGHSNTVTYLVEAFGLPPVCPEVFPEGPSGCWIPDGDYHHMFVVTVPSNGDPAVVVHETFGAE